MRPKTKVSNKFNQGDVKGFNFAILILILILVLYPGDLKADKLDDELVRRAEQSIEKISTLEAEFTQISSNGSYVIGRLYFRRPFQMRMEYNQTKPYNLITTRKWLIVDEPSDKKITNYPISETPLAPLLAEKISLTGEGFSTEGRIFNGLAEIALSKKEGALSGTLILLFELEYMNLRGWIITDTMGVKTTVTLQNEIYDRILPNKLFGWPVY